MPDSPEAPLAGSGFDAMSRMILAFALSAMTALLMACGRADEVATFDAQLVAAEADKGNLGPMTEFVKACTAEVSETVRRAELCAVLDKAGALRKPLDIRF